MNAPPGWYPDPGDAHITRYWDGDRYTRELRWDGTAWVDPAATPPPAATPTPVTATPVTPTPETPAAATPTPETVAPLAAIPETVAPLAANPPVAATPVAASPVPAPTPAPPVDPQPTMPPPAFAPVAATGAVPAAPGTGRPNPTPTFWIFMAGSVGVAVSALLPWVSVSVSGFGTSISTQPGTGGPGVLILFAIAVGAIAWPTISSPALSKARKIGLIPIVGFLAIAVVTNWSDLANLKDQYDGGTSGLGVSIDAGIGFYLYTVCVIALVVAVVRVWLAGARATASS